MYTFIHFPFPKLRRMYTVYIILLFFVLHYPSVITSLIISNYGVRIHSKGYVIYTQPGFSAALQNVPSSSYDDSKAENLPFYSMNLSDTLNRNLTAISHRSTRKLFDVFCYNGELSLLLWRITHLGPYVTTFMVIEGDHSHQGTPQESKLTPSIKEQIAQIGAHVIYLRIPLKSRPANLVGDELRQFATENEMRQRSAGIAYLLNNSNDDDMIISGDVDELPDPEYIRGWRTFPSTGLLRFKMFYYNFDCLQPYYWAASSVISIDMIKQTLAKSKPLDFLQVLYTSIDTRDVKFQYPSLTGLNVTDIPLSVLRLTNHAIFPVHYRNPKGYEDVGWHCSYFMSPSDIRNKLRSFLHSEYSGERYSSYSNIYQAILNCGDLFGRGKMIHRPDYFRLPPMHHTITQCTPESVQPYVGK